jgi:hypothetical protein
MSCRLPIRRPTGACAIPCAPNSRCPGNRLEKNPEQARSFQENFSHLPQDKLTEVQSRPHPSAERPIRLFYQEESRFGLVPIQRRRITLTGVKPLSRLDQYEVGGWIGWYRPITPGHVGLSAVGRAVLMKLNEDIGAL